MVRGGLQFLVDGKGRKKGVVMGMKEYRDMVRRVEELEDALELDEAIRTATEFRDYREVRRNLKDEDLR